jgi:hypothetical protein
MKKIKHFILATGLLALSCFANAQTPRAIEWQKSFGGDGPDIAYGAQQTSDGGYIIGGFSGNNNGDITGSLANTNYWVVKTNSAGAIQWQKTLGSSGGDQGLSIVQTNDGGYIIVGETTQSGSSGNVVGGHGGLDVLVVKLNSSGATEWNKTFGGSGDERATSVIQTADGGYAFTGLASSNNGDVTNSHNSVDYWVVKLTSNGTMSWQKTYGGSGDDRAYCIKQTTDGGYVVTGESNTNNDGDVTGNHGNIDMWVIKINSTGTLQWQQSFGGSNQERGRSIVQTADGGYIVAGCTNSSNSGDVTGNRSETITQCYGDPSDPWYFCDTYTQDFNDYWVVKISSTGTMQWQKYYGGTSDDEAYSIIQTSDGGYAISGYAGSSNGVVNGFHGDYDAWVIKTDNAGDIQWQKAYGGTRVEYGNSISETSDGGYIVAGATAYGVDGDVTLNHGDWDWWVFKLKGIAKSTTNLSICSSALPFTWNGLTLNASGTQTKYFGTDSVAILNLTVLSTPITPSVSISNTNSPICDNATTTFIASTSTGGTSPVFQWKRNGGDVGSGSSIQFLTGSLTSGDVITCVMTANNACQTTATANSNTITVSVKQSVSVTPIYNATSGILSSTGLICAYGDTLKLVDYTPNGAWSSNNSSVASVVTAPNTYGRVGNVIANADGVSTVNYNIISTDGCVTSATSVVTVAAIAAPTAITGSSAVCVGSSVTLSSTTTGGVWSSVAGRATVNASGLVTGTSAGTASIKYTVGNAASCSTFVSKTVAVNALPAIPSIAYGVATVNPQAGAGGGNNFCTNRTFTVVGSPTGGVWSKTGVLSVTTPGGAVNTGAVAGAGSLTYTVTTNGCSSSRSIVGAVVTCAARGAVSNEQLASSSYFTMYPNPAKTFISLNVETLIGSGKLLIIDYLGKVVKEQTLSMGTNTVDIAYLSKGMYFVSTITSEGKTTKKLVVE